MKNKICAIVFTLLSLPAFAQSVWTGATDSAWSTATNWSVPPVSSNTLAVSFTGPSANLATTVDANYTLNSLVMGSAASYSIGGLLGALSFNGTNPQLIVQGPGHIISALLLLPVPTTFVMGDSILVGDVSGASLAVNGGPGILTLAGTVMPNPTNVDPPATLRLGNGVAGPIGATASVVVNGTLETNGGFTGFVNNVTGSGSVHAIGGPGTLHFMDHTGTTTVDAGASLAGRITNNALLTVDGRLDTTGSTVGSLTGIGQVFVNGGTLTLGGDNSNQIFAGTDLGGTGNLLKIGTGRQVLAHQNTYSGTTTINGGTLAFGNGTPWPSLVFGTIVDNGALELDVAVPPGISFNGTTGSGTLRVLSGLTAGGPMAHAGTTTVDAGAQLTGTVNNNALLTVNGTFHSTGTGSTVGSLSGAGTGHVFIDSPTVTLGGDNTDQVYAGIDLGGAGGLVKNGSGRQTIAVTGMYFGTTTINGGTLRFGNGVIAGPGFVFNTITDNGAIEFNVPTSVGVNPFGGSGSVRVVGGALNTNGALTHAGTTTIDAGATFTGPINNNALLTVNGTMNLAPFLPTTVGSLTGSGLVNTSAAFTVGSDNTSTTYSGQFANSGDLTKLGTGTLTLTGASGGVVGLTFVNAGTLIVNGTHIASGIIVASGATLGGSGFVGPVIVNGGGRLAPGNSPGLLTTASLSLAGNLLQEIQGTARGTQYDAVDVNGTVNITGATLTLSGAYVPVAGNTFTIISNDGADPVTGTFAGLPQGATIPFNGRTLRISYVGGSGNDVVLSFLAAGPLGAATPVPTLSQWVLMLLACVTFMTGFLAIRRR